MLGFFLKNTVYAIAASSAFYALLLFGDLAGLREISSASFTPLAAIVTFLTFSFSALNIRIN